MKIGLGLKSPGPLLMDGSSLHLLAPGPPQLLLQPGYSSHIMHPFR